MPEPGRCVSSSPSRNRFKPEDGQTNLVYAVGLNDDDFAKPQIGISPMWWEGVLAIDQSSVLLW